MDPSAYEDIRFVRLFGHHGHAEYVVEATRTKPSGWRFDLQFVNDNRQIELGTFAEWSEGLEAAMEVAAVGAARFNQEAVEHLVRP